MSTIPVLASKTDRVSGQNPRLILKQLIIASAVNVRYCWYFSIDWLSGPPMVYWLHTSVTSDCTQTCVTLAPTVGGCRGGS
jgi:hypothetical protein